MSPDARLAVERAIIELSDADEALTLTTVAIRRRLTAALGALTKARDEQATESTEAEVQS